MNWYLAKLVFSIEVNTGGPAAQFEEQLRAISARNESEAFLKARMLGAREEDMFLNESLNAVRWTFLNVTELKPLGELTDGMTLHSRIFEEDADGSYLRFVTARSLGIEERAEKQPVTGLGGAPFENVKFFAS